MTTPRSVWLSALGAFESAARHQNFARAAEELHLTASAVSHHVRKLEARLGVALFQRHARGVGLTPEGRLLADAAATALSDVDTVFNALGPMRTAARVRIATLHSFAYTWVIPRLASFTRAHPDIRLSFETGIALTRFDEGGPDLGIRHGLGHWPGLTALPLLDEHLFPVTGPATPGRESVRTAADVVKLPLLADLARQGWLDWFRAAGVRRVRLGAMHTFSDTTDALMAAACGLGAALARTHIAAPYLADGRLVRLPGPSMKARFGYHVIYPAHRRLSAPAAAFVDWLRAEAADDRRETADGDAASEQAPALRQRRKP